MTRSKHKIHETKNAKEICGFIDVVDYPYLDSFCCTLYGNKIKVLGAEILEDIKCEIMHVDKLVFIKDGMPTIICLKGMINIIMS